MKKVEGALRGIALALVVAILTACGGNPEPAIDDTHSERVAHAFVDALRQNKTEELRKVVAEASGWTADSADQKQWHDRMVALIDAEGSQGLLLEWHRNAQSEPMQYRVWDKKTGKHVFTIRLVNVNGKPDDVHFRVHWKDTITASTDESASPLPYATP